MVVSEIKIIKLIGYWYQNIKYESDHRIEEEKKKIEHYMNITPIQHETRAYYELVNFKHEIELKNVLERTLVDRGPKKLAMKETDEALEFLYNYMEGNVHYDLGNYRSSLQQYKIADRFTGTLNVRKKAIFMLRMGDNFQKLKQINRAEQYIADALDMCLEVSELKSESIRCQKRLKVLQAEKSRQGEFESLIEHSFSMVARE